MFTRLLIANRGEIACRIARTARRLGIHTIAVFSDADADARHVALCDEAWRLGPAPAAESYLHIERILEIAQRSGAQAVHPGYGFLAEHAGFAHAVTEHGLVFVGPPADAIAAMGDKLAAKRLIEQAGVPLVAGYHGDDQSTAGLAHAAAAIGYPVLIKAALGGGGKGMRVVRTAAEFEPMLASCRREAKNAFGDDRVLLERYLVGPRHIEIQILADRHGHCVHLFERDCSVQRRHQKVLEEAPAPGLDAAQRQAMAEAAIAAARAVDYVGAGTVEFIADASGSFHFMEMNTRLQVEHPVTEMITGLDLVEWQLRIAAGQPLPERLADLRIGGHAIEARIYAENPERDFLPSTGTLRWLNMPAAVEFAAREAPDMSGSVAPVRIDSGVRRHDTIGPHYDPLIAKLIAHGTDRAEALARLSRALAACEIAGVTSNVEFLARLCRTPAFVAGRIDTGLVERERKHLLPAPGVPSLQRRALAAAAILACEQASNSGHAPGRNAGNRSGSENGACTSSAAVADAGRRRAASWPADPWNIRNGWRIGSRLLRTLALVHAGTPCPVQVEYAGDRWVVREPAPPAETRASSATADDSVSVEAVHWQAAGYPDRCGPIGAVRCTLDGQRLTANVVFAGAALQVFSILGHDRFDLADVSAGARDGDVDAPLVAPMPGKVIAVFVRVGAQVERGQALLAIEAMKMEHTIVAPTAGRVEALPFGVGDQVTEGERLVQFTASGSGAHEAAAQ